MKSVLIFRSAALGDFVISMPAIDKVRHCFPDHRVVLLTIQSFSKEQHEKVIQYTSTAKSNPWLDLAMPHLIDESIVIDRKLSLHYLLQLRKILHTYNFDTVIVMVDPCAPWVGRIKKILFLKFLVGHVPFLGWRGRGSLKGNLTELKNRGLLRHHVHGPLQFLSEMKPPRNYRDEDLSFDLRPGQVAINLVDAWINNHGLSERRLVVMAPGSIQPHKRWPEASFRSLIEKLLSKYDDISIVIVGTPKDHEIGERFAQLAPDRVLNLAGNSNIAQSAALMARCTLVVGNDGGAMHLADAMGAKVISLVPGIEYPDSIEPWHNKDLAIRWPVECAPCYSFTSCPEGHNKCMNAIPVSLVLDKCTSIL